MLGAEAAGAGADAAGAAELQGMHMCYASASRAPHDIKAGDFVRLNQTYDAAGWLAAGAAASELGACAHTSALYVTLDKLGLQSKSMEVSLQRGQHTELAAAEAPDCSGALVFGCKVNSHISTSCCACHITHFHIGVHM